MAWIDDKWVDTSREFVVLKGQTLTKCWASTGDDELHFVTTDGKHYLLYHSQDCCESVTIESIVGNLDDLIDEPLLIAEEVANGPIPENHDSSDYDSETWTFYKLATRKGYVDIRWFGTSNGYYSESVDFEEVFE